MFNADLRRLAKESVYVGVGLGVLGFQRAQVVRRELEKRLSPLLPKSADELAKELAAFGRLALQVLSAPTARRRYP